MGISMNSICAQCFFNRRLNMIHTLGTDEQATEISKRIFQMFAQSPKDTNSAILGGLVDAEIYRFYGIDPDRLKEEKRLSNEFALGRMDRIAALVEKQPDPVYAALQFAVLGNYLDFASLQGQVSFDELDRMLENALEMDLDKATYQDFCRDLEAGTSFLYITDNAGEIVFDRVLAETVQKAYPHIQITFLVRGGPVSNDATRLDAQAVGIPFPVIDSGVALCGTVLEQISPEALAAVQGADVILAKGMGNTEAMLGCGYNVYYAFLVKCARFMQVFNKPKMTPMFIRDADS